MEVKADVKEDNPSSKIQSGSKIITETDNQTQDERKINTKSNTGDKGETF